MKPLLRAALLLLLAGPAVAAPPAGNWKFRTTLPSQQGTIDVTFLLAFSETDGKWVGDYIGTSVGLRVEPKVVGLTVAGDAVKFNLQLQKGGPGFEFEGVLAKDGKKLSGTVSRFGGPLELTDLYPSKLKKLTDPYDLAREDFGQIDGGPQLFDTGFVVLAKAAEKKLTADEVRGVAERLTKAAAGYGTRWERTTALKLADTLAGQAGMDEVAVAQVRRAERMLADDAPLPLQITVLEAVARVLTKCGKAADAKKYEADLAKLEAQDLSAYTKETLKFEPPAFGGRKAKSDRVVVVELFTGSESDECAPANVAFDALMKTFKPADVVFLQHHVHVPGPDPLANDDSMNRGVSALGRRIRELLPSVYVNGKSAVKPGAEDAKAIYTDVRAAIEKELEGAATAKLSVAVTKGEKGLTVTAKVTDLEKPGEKVALRFAVVEPLVRYAGGNGSRFHQNVVRAMPGTPAGFPLKMKAHEQAVTVNADDLRGELNKYLDSVAEKFAPFPNPDRPLRMKNLKVIAFIQDDASGDILTATQVEMDAK